MMYERGFRRFLSVLLILSLMFLTNPPRSFGAIQNSVNVYLENGSLKFHTVDIYRSSNIYYSTEGWIITRSKGCQDAAKTVCHPMEAKGGYALLPKMEDGIMVPPNPGPGDMVTTDYSIPEKTVSDALEDQGLGDLHDGDPIYLHSIFYVYENGKKKGPYYTLEGIRDAEPWGNTSVFPQYYDIEKTYPSPEFPVNASFRDINGQVLKNVDLGKFKSGYSMDYSFPTTFQSGGVNYTLSSSFYTKGKDTGTKYNVKSGSGQQHLVVSINGDTFVGVYMPITPQEPPKGKSDLDPKATGEVKADDRGNEHFDVSQGIPTTESLYANVKAKNFLYKYNFKQVVGLKPYNVSVSKTYNLTWTDPPTGPDDTPVDHSESKTITKTVTLYRQYAYWVIDDLQVYDIDHATVNNYALPNGSVVIDPQGYQAPKMTVSHSDAESAHITDPPLTPIDLGSEDVSGSSPPNEDFTGEADPKFKQIIVNNDHFVFNGTTVMSDQKVENEAPEPIDLPVPSDNMIGDNVLYKPDQVIEATLLNKKDAPSDGKITYEVTPGSLSGSTTDYPINNLNTVTVHTPVVAYATISDDAAHNQQTVPTPGYDALILDRNFTVTLPTSGEHKDIKGYGNRDYRKYTEAKEVNFPFDVYKVDGSTRTFYPKNTWVSLNLDQTNFTFFTPVWVDEGYYDVLFREIAINAPPDYTNKTEPDANRDLNHYIATDIVKVEVIGRLYDFHVTDIADYSYETVFRQSKNSATPTGISYWVGDKMIDGEPRGNNSILQLPVHMGSNLMQGYGNVAVKTGYHFKFDLKTKGNMFGTKDGIRITPNFYYVPKGGGSTDATPVDLYYRTQSKTFVKIGSSDDKEQRYVVLNTPLRNVPSDELSDTAGYIFDHYQVGSYTKASYTSAYFRGTQNQTWVGNYTLLMLTQPLRTFIGPDTVPAGVDAGRAKAAIQKWYGEYSLPAAPYVVDRKKYPTIQDFVRTHPNDSLDDQSDLWLKNGYIVVNFNIETIQNENVSSPHLQYYKYALDNQWQMEGFHSGVVDTKGATFALHDGDVMFYDTDHSSRDDFGSGGTH